MPSTDDTAAQQDAFQWLEQLHSPEAMSWVQQQNQRTEAQLAQEPEFEALQQRLLDRLNNEHQIPWVGQYGDHYYNFWQDKQNPRGLWRRTPLAQYAEPNPEWEVVLDIDALGKAEGIDWVFRGSQVLRPEYRYCLISLSPDGGDAAAVREFDLVTKQWVSDGFTLPVARSMVSWIDHNQIFVATDTGPGSMTQSGYVRIARRWQRGTPVSSAEILFEAQPEDMRVEVYHDSTPGYARDYVGRRQDFYHTHTYLLTADNQQIKIDIPDDAEFSTHQQWLLIKINSPWQIAEQTYPSGSLLATDFDAFLAGQRQMEVLFTPTAHSALDSFSHTRDHLILSIMDHVVNRLEILTPQQGQWQRRPLDLPTVFGSLSAHGVNLESNDYLLTISGFLQPTALYRGTVDQGLPTLLKQGPIEFDAADYQVSQHFATSLDGTQIPYFQIAARDLVLDGSHPTLLYGYGGFDVSLLPHYLGGEQPGWLSKGGVYVLANIRGGGEYGPDWHQAALKQHRHRAYEDFAAVAQDLIARKVTVSPKLAVRGGSNGGLLVGNMLTRYPELFGAIVCEVPLLDMQRYTQLSVGASWIAEYGDPSKPEEWAYLQTNSPYHNLQAGVKYPPILFYTATSDDRVHPSHARKMAAKMQQMGYQQVYSYENTEGGHSAAANKQQAAFHHALVNRFLWQHLQG